jgi:hypothetical protein
MAGLITPQYFERIKVIASVLTPLVILLLGLEVNHALEKSKAQLLKDKDWTSQWADRFYAQVVFFNDTMEETLVLLSSMIEEVNIKKIGWEKRKKDLDVKYRENMPRSRKIIMSLEMMAQFCPNSEAEVLSASKLVLEQINILIEKQIGSFEEIRKSLHSFNKIAMKAHREILDLSYQDLGK